MKKQRRLIIHFVSLFLLLRYMPLMADGRTSFATYTPIPMRSTSSMPMPTSGVEISSTAWEKPGTWSDPVDGGDEGGGSGGYDKPGNWDDPYEGANPDTPVGSHLLAFSLMLAAYALLKKRKRKHAAQQTSAAHSSGQ